MERVWARGSVEVAPFEDRIELFLPKNGSLEKALLSCCEVQVIARKDTGEYSLRMEGRAHAGLHATRHPARAALEPWKPEERSLQQFMAAPFVPELMELVRTEADDRVRYHGKTPAGEQRPRYTSIWGQACFGGRALFMAIGAFVFPFLWLGYMGADYLGRPGAMVISLAVGLCLVASVRLWAVQLAYRQWRLGKALRSEASVLADGLLAPFTAARVSIYLGVIGTIGGILLWSLWDPEIAMVAVFANGAWLAGPASWMHLAAGKPEPK